MTRRSMLRSLMGLVVGGAVAKRLLTTQVTWRVSNIDHEKRTITYIRVPMVIDFYDA